VLKEKSFKEANHYVWDDPHLFKIDADNLLRRCVLLDKAKRIILQCQYSAYGGHFNGEKTAANILR